jgi:hypothetical protein
MGRAHGDPINGGSTPGEYVVNLDPGGAVDEIVTKYHMIAMTRRIVIAGDCDSACTFAVLSLPAGRACAKPGSRFGFHSLSYQGIHAPAPLTINKEYAALYLPAKIREWFIAHAARSLKVKYLPGTVVLPECRP